MPLGLSKKCSAIAPSATLAMDAKAKELRSQGVNVIGFAAGEPDFETPAPIREAMKEAMDLGMTRYTPAAGTLELRRAIAARLLEDHGLVYGMDEIVVSNGAKHSLYNAFQAILDPGDEVIVDQALLGELSRDGAHGRRRARVPGLPREPGFPALDGGF